MGLSPLKAIGGSAENQITQRRKSKPDDQAIAEVVDFELCFHNGPLAILTYPPL